MNVCCSFRIQGHDVVIFQTPSKQLVAQIDGEGGPETEPLETHAEAVLTAMALIEQFEEDHQ